MTKVIVFNGEMGVAVMFPAPDSGLTVEETAAKDVPQNTPFIIVEYEDIPADRPQDCWSIDFDNNKVFVDDEKVKTKAVALAETQRADRVQEANTVIVSNNWTTKLALGRLKENEKEALNSWLDYIDVLEEIDTGNAPDIVWPEAPVK